MTLPTNLALHSIPENWGVLPRVSFDAGIAEERRASVGRVAEVFLRGIIWPERAVRLAHARFGWG
jgi:hypothetical protein